MKWQYGIISLLIIVGVMCLIWFFNKKSKKIKIKSYPDMNGIMRLYPNPEILLGHEIFWQEKKDGSNLGVWIDKKNKIHLRSRNAQEASSDFYNIFNRTDEAKKIKELLVDQRDEYNKDYVIFGEILRKGKSPTKTEIHEKDEFIVFDIWNNEVKQFMPCMWVYQQCYHFKIPTVELYGTSKHTSTKSLLKFRDDMLVKAKENGCEGVVGKCYSNKVRQIYFKEKLDLPKLEKIPRHLEEGYIQLPQLAESEILGALDKTLVDLGFKDFRDIKKAMPLFAKYVAIECKKHNCENRMKLFSYYNTKLEEM